MAQAIDLNDDQRQRWTRAWAGPGKHREVRSCRHTVLGGIVAQVGDTVIDGSVRSRLDQLKNAF